MFYELGEKYMQKRKHVSRFLGRASKKRNPSFIEKVEMLFKDVNTVGKKQGFERAAKEYEKAYSAIEKEFKKTKELIEKQKNTYETQTEELTEMYIHLKQLKAELERQVNLKANEVSLYYDIPMEEIIRNLKTGTLLINIFTFFPILGVIYNHKGKKLREAEQQGYIEAKDLHEEKIDKLKVELGRLRENADEDIQQLLSLISEMLDSIAKEQTKITDLAILL